MTEGSRSTIYASFDKKLKKAKKPKVRLSAERNQAYTRSEHGSDSIKSGPPKAPSHSHKIKAPTKASSSTTPRRSTRVLDLGHNPSKAVQKAGADLLRASGPKRSKTAKAPATSKRPTWWDKPAVEATSFSTSGISKAVSKTGATAAAAIALTGVAAAVIAVPKRNKGAAVTAAKARKPITTPGAPKIKPIKIKTPGATAQASPELKLASEKRRAAEGAKLKQAGYGTKPEAPKAPTKPRNITEYTAPKAPKAPKAPEAPKAETPVTVRPAPKKQSFVKGVVDAIRNPNIVAEERAAAAYTPKITTPVDPPKEAKPEGRMKKIVRGPDRAASATLRAAKNKAAALTQTIADAAAGPAKSAERRAAESVIVTPVDKPKATPTPKPKPTPRATPKPRPTPKPKAPKAAPRPDAEFEGLSPDQLKAKKSELEARIETDRAAKAAPKAETADDGEQPRTERRDKGQRRSATRMTQKQATVESGVGVRPEGSVAPKTGSRRKRGRGTSIAPIRTPNVAPEKDLAKQLEEARAENRARGGSESKKQQTALSAAQKRAAAPADQAEVNKELAAAKSKKPKTTTPKFGATEAEVDKVARSGETTKPPTASQKKANAAKIAELPKDVQDMVAEIESEADKTSRSATDKADAREAAKAKKATQKFYTDKGKRIEAAGSARQGTSTAVNPQVAGAAAATDADVPVHKTRRPTDDLIKEQGVEVKQIPAKTAPETDAVSKDWEDKAENRKAARSPLAQAKLNAEELGIQIAETEASKGTMGTKIREASGIEDTLTKDVAEFKGKRIIRSVLNPEGEFETSILEGKKLDQTVVDAVEDLRKGGDRRAGEATRRNFASRLTAAEASDLITDADVKTRIGEKKVGSKKSSRRDKQPGGDRRQKGSTYKPVNVAEEVAKSINNRPGGLPDRRGPTMLDLDVGELKDAAAKGDAVAKETLSQVRAELKGRGKERRAMDTAPREASRLELDLERDANKTPESTSVWDEKSKRVTPKTQMDVKGEFLKFPSIADYEAETSPTKRVVPDVERRGSVRGLDDRVTQQKTPDRRLQGNERRIANVAPEITTPVDKRVGEVELVSGDKRTAPEDKRKPTGENREGQRRGLGRQRGTHEYRTGSTTVDLMPTEPSRPTPTVRTTKPLKAPSIGASIGANISEAFKRIGRGALNAAKNPKARGAGMMAGGLGLGSLLFSAQDVGAAYLDAPGNQQDRLKAAGGQALESGFVVAGSMALFGGALKGAEKVTVKTMAKFGATKSAQAIGAGAVGAAGTLLGAAAVGSAVGYAGAEVSNRVKRVSRKNARDSAYAKKHYGTVEAATRTRQERKRTMTLDEADAIMQRFEQEQNKYRSK